jgi:protein-tyrosine-phosphatase
MAEAFARTYGPDVLIPSSAGVAPAASISRDTARVMEEKNIRTTGQYPKPFRRGDSAGYDLIINMSGQELGNSSTPVREWTVRDPIGEDLETYRTVRDQIEMLVMQLILELRRRRKNMARS